MAQAKLRSNRRTGRLQVTQLAARLQTPVSRRFARQLWLTMEDRKEIDPEDSGTWASRRSNSIYSFDYLSGSRIPNRYGEDLEE